MAINFSATRRRGFAENATSCSFDAMNRLAASLVGIRNTFGGVTDASDYRLIIDHLEEPGRDVSWQRVPAIRTAVGCAREPR
jgi:hypothetical protein